MAEDVVQHVFVKLWESTDNIHIEINLKKMIIRNSSYCKFLI
jgi:DNA-directed RNA polymerase specialized sigma24 family protein